MKTIISVQMNGAGFDYKFDVDYETLCASWDNQINAVGYFSGIDEDGRYITINPSQCGIVEVRMPHPREVRE